ncbi:phosphonate ABC transporter substrate-binding protein [Advenella faeciporci]|uniref:Phosphonate ABC transporter substrate-binding protein n=1 Tax=Advenella faeciporci TaxID=797535 RepID=A0A918MYS1_9BURK|nr:phosphonate ABC transporter substrate-binding protein [Advenella faeciporci]GGW87167.1 phosphonate ABC transporter substrate-binding protein [Advenella faeciporci]
MLKSIYQRVGVSLLAAALTAGAAYAQEKKEINFGIISTESSQNLRQVWEPFLDDMSKKTGYKVKAFFAPDYAGIIQGMRFDKVDIAWYGNKSAMEAVDRANGEVIFQSVDKDGKPGYWSLLIAHKDSPINNLDDMLAQAKNLNFGNGDPNSTSGYLVPGYYVFAQNNVDPNKIFKRAVNGSHEVNALSVANKQLDVATNNTESVDRLKKTNPEKAALIKEIWRSPLIPADPIVWRKNLPEDVKVKFNEFFTTYGDKPEELAVLNNLDWGKFKVSSNDQLLPIRQLELFKKRNQVVNDAKLSDADKQAQLQALDADLDKLVARMKELEAKKS